ncbi:hypothetical protein [Asanoa iriomotensis]|uniref:hypothetical protein n=1 Tax=Asanoa iriomotensis TaxID=234613 RepID=UPI00194297B7|nr:hypothetical protein [Asanoa iriomotensis]
MRAAAQAAAELHRNLDSSGDALHVLTTALQHPSSRRTALIALSVLETDVTAALVAPVVEASLSHRDALLARQVIGRIPYRVYEAAVPGVVNDLLADADDDTYRRLAELLDHLGLDPQLELLCERAASSDDPDIREVAADFGPY